MIVDGQIITSNSLLATVAQCSTRTVLRYVHRRQAEGESGPLLLGKAWHKAMEVRWSGGTIKAAMKAFRKGYKTWALENIDPDDRFQARLSWENTRKIVRAYFERFPLSSYPFTVDPNCLEVEFWMPLNKRGDIISRGIIDAGPVVHKQTGSLYNVDHKSSSGISPWWLAKFKMDSQSTNYTWATGELTPQPISGFYLNVLEFKLLPGMNNPEMKCKDPAHGKVPYRECQPLHVKSQVIMLERGPETVRQWKRDAIRFARRYAELHKEWADLKKVDRIPQEGRFNGGCQYCDFQDFCLVGRPYKMLDKMTVPRISDRDEHVVPEKQKAAA